jgi:hypothetical protein
MQKIRVGDTLSSSVVVECGENEVSSKMAMTDLPLVVTNVSE